MSSDVTDPADRLAEIKWLYQERGLSRNDEAWLIGEVGRLRAENERLWLADAILRKLTDSSVKADDINGAVAGTLTEAEMAYLTPAARVTRSVDRFLDEALGPAAATDGGGE